MQISQHDLNDLRERIRLASLPLIASQLRAARREKGLSHDRLGELMGGVTRQHLIKLEKAKHRPTPAMLLGIAGALDKPLDFFLVEEDGHPNPFRDAA